MVFAPPLSAECAQRAAPPALCGSMNTTFFLGLVLSLALLPSNVVAATLLLLRAEWHASALAIAWVFAAYQVGYLIAVLFLLPLTDRVPAGRVMAGCAVASSTAFVLFPLLAHDVWSAAWLRLLAGLGLAGIYLPGVRVVAAATAPPRRGYSVGAYVWPSISGRRPRSG